MNNKMDWSKKIELIQERTKTINFYDVYNKLPEMF